MKSDWINPFLSAAWEIFGTYGLEFKTGSPKVQDFPMLASEVNVAIGITGDIKGQVILSLGTDDALGVAKNVVPWELTEFDEMASSSISEITNILAGKASFFLEQVGLATDLSVPTVITGQGIKVSNIGLQHIIIPFELKEASSESFYEGFLSVSMQSQ